MALATVFGGGGSWWLLGIATQGLLWGQGFLCITCCPALLTPLPSDWPRRQPTWGWPIRHRPWPPLGSAHSRGLLGCWCQCRVIRLNGGVYVCHSSGRPGPSADEADVRHSSSSIWAAGEAGSPWPAGEDQVGLAK